MWSIITGTAAYALLPELGMRPRVQGTPVSTSPRTGSATPAVQA